jgi:hypothetical protein
MPIRHRAVRAFEGCRAGGRAVSESKDQRTSSLGAICRSSIKAEARPSANF